METPVWDALPWAFIHTIFLPCTQNWVSWARSNVHWSLCILLSFSFISTKYKSKHSQNRWRETAMTWIFFLNDQIWSQSRSTNEIRHGKTGAETLTSGWDISLGAGQCWIWPKLQQSCCSAWWLSVYFYTQVHDSLTAWPGNWTSQAGFSSSQAAAVQIFLEAFCTNMLPLAVFLTKLQPRCTPPNADILQSRNWDWVKDQFHFEAQVKTTSV